MTSTIKALQWPIQQWKIFLLNEDKDSLWQWLECVQLFILKMNRSYFRYVFVHILIRRLYGQHNQCITGPVQTSLHETVDYKHWRAHDVPCETRPFDDCVCVTGVSLALSLLIFLLTTDMCNPFEVWIVAPVVMPTW